MRLTPPSSGMEDLRTPKRTNQAEIRSATLKTAMVIVATSEICLTDTWPRGRSSALAES